MKKTLLLIAVFTLTMLTSFSQDKKRKDKKEKPLVDYRIDNMGYWRKMASLGLVPVQPNTKPEKAIIKSSRINTRSIKADSPDVPVSNTGTDTQSEVSIFVNPTDNSKILNSNNSTNWNGSSVTSLHGTSYLSSDDFGVTWGGSVQGAGGANSGDPAALINLNGRHYIGFIHSNSGQGVSYSDDGITWTSVMAGNSTGATILDKNHLWVDNSPSSPHVGNVYNAWTDFNTGNGIFFVRSTDDGLSYSTPMNISSGVNAGNLNQGVNINSGPNGEVYVTWIIYDNDITENAIGFAKSTDGGATFEPAIRIHNNIQGIRGVGVLKNHRVNSFPSMTVDISGGNDNGNIYVVWSNIGEPGVNTGSNKSVYMIKSTDGGANWETPIKVNQGAFLDGKEAYFPWITSDPESGVLSAIFYDDRDVTPTQVETWVANSYDGGTTWEDFRVSDVAFTPQPIAGLATGYMGDYLGISARGGFVYPAWPDNRNGYIQTFISPYETNSRVRPTNLQIALTEATGQTDLTWDFAGAATFLNFVIYRDGTQIATTTNLFYTDNLPAYGVYNYSVTAMHNDGESSESSSSIQWGNPNISVTPSSLTETLLTNETSVKILTVTNIGELGLTYNLNTAITNKSSRSPEAYCSASGGGDEYISGVTFGSISNTGTGEDDYTDYTAMSTDIDAGGSYPITFTIGSAYSSDDLNVWIDWNQDDDFEDAGEQVLCESSIGASGTYNYTINVPADALKGQTTMRVRLTFYGSCGAPCGATSYGEVEDYSVNVNSWLQVGTYSGSLAPGASEDINVNFDSTDLALGDYNAIITINSNATDTPQVDVPVTLHVVEDTSINATATADDTEICDGSGSSTILHANPSGGTGTYTFSWTSVPAGFTSTDENPSVSPTVNTVYSVVVDDGLDNVSSDIAITIVDTPVQTTAPTGAITICQDAVNETYTTATVVSATSYSWTISPASAGTITGNTVSAMVNWDQNFNGNATISVSAVNTCGTGLSSDLVVTVNELPTVTLTSFNAVCLDALSFALTGGLPTGGSYSGVGVSGGNFDSINAGVGVHTITYAYTNTNGCENFATQTIEVYALPTVTLASFNTVNDSEPAFELTGGLPIGGTYNGNGVAGGFFDAAVAGIGVHTITYTYVDANGCENSAQQTIEVEETLGVNDVENGINFNLYPNPNEGELNLTINSLIYQNFDIKIVNQIGITVVNKKINVSNGSDYTFDLTHLTTGVYYFTLNSEKLNYVQKIIVKK